MKFLYLVWRILKAAFWAAVVFAIVSVIWVFAYRFAAPPTTFLILSQSIAGQRIERAWQPLDRISSHLIRAVIVAEDQKFCDHNGFDVDAIRDALDDKARGGRTRGASTISMQTSKNAYLWPGRTWIRKGFEAWFTLLTETLWPKRRIMEVYLNVAEWGPGIFGADAAARHHFGRRADQLRLREAALLAAILPSPRSWSADQPGDYVRERAHDIERQMRASGEFLAKCVGR